MPKPAPTLTLVAPCFNEAVVIRQTAAELLGELGALVSAGAIQRDSAVYFVDDGSSDETWARIEALCREDPRCHGIKLSRNFGHQNALLSGILTAPGDAIITIDADLQDDPKAIPEMVRAYAAGADVVYGVRARRSADSLLKRLTAVGYYRVAGMLGVEMVFNHADYRLLSRRAVDALKQYGERNVFLRGIVPRLGFPSATVDYDRRGRAAGESKYPIRKMLAFAIDGITSFSAVPLQLITLVGLAVSMASLITAAWAIGIRVFTTRAVPGWTSTVVPMALLGGIQLFCTGIIGQYLSKIYLETKARPRYVIETVL